MLGLIFAVLLVCPNLFYFLMDFAAIFCAGTGYALRIFSRAGYHFHWKILEQVKIFLWLAHPRIKSSTLPRGRCQSTYDLNIDQFRFQSIEKCFVFVIFACSHITVFKMCRLEICFQNLPFSKSADKNVLFSCERDAHPSHFSPFSKCAGIV